LLGNIKTLTTPDKLITHLDNAIFALFDNSKNSKIANDLVTLRQEFSPMEEVMDENLSLNIMPSIK
jgi:hypothetical protein